MKISIITVCLNSELTIAKTLNSVAQQSYKDVEHIIVDGVSSDRTLQIINSEGLHVSKLISEKDKGIYDAMNKGVALATGDVIAFLNADDFYANHDVLQQVAETMRNKQLDALYGDVEFFRASKPNEVIRKYNSGLFTPARLRLGIMPAHPALFLKRAIFERCGPFDISYKISGDFEFIARAFKGRDLKALHLRQIFVRMQSGGVSTSGWRSTLRINRENIRACRNNGIYTNWAFMMLRYPFKLFEFFVM
jgi:glycosyltransferase involved in cell wall biosynthesis